MDGGDGISSDDVSSMAIDEVTIPNAWPPMGPTENDAAVLRQLMTRVYRGVFEHSRLPLGSPNTGHTVIFVESTPDGVDAEADADAGADDNDDFGFGFTFGAVPASGVAMACLPETTVAEGEAGERGECAVCLEEYAAGDALRTMPCAHGFHERCIFGWLSASRLCPLCRFALPPEEDEDTAADGVEVGRDDQGDGEADDDGSDGARETFEYMYVNNVT